jgi:hypothetical protein
MPADCTVQLPRRKQLKTTRAQRAAALKEIEAWNAKVPVGADVCLHKDSGEKVHSRTRSAAQLMCDSAVAWFDGVSGAYAIDHAHPIEVANG